MKHLFASVIACCLALFAKPGVLALEPIQSAVGFGGLQISLTTGGYKFTVGDATAATDGTWEPRWLTRDSFAASAILANRSNGEIKFVFPNPVAAEKHFRFRVFDSTGKEIWSSDESGSPQVLTEESLRRRSAWRRTVLVPLRLEGKALAPGIYTLEALVDADKQVGATSIFEVVAPPNPDDKQTGIKGQVLRATGIPPEAGNPLPTEVPVGGARITVTEITDPNAPMPVVRAPFFWQGVTNNEGRFQVETPAGKFRVTATLPIGPLGPNPDNNLLPPIPPSKTTEVTVESGHYSEVTFRFPAPQPPTSDDTGIKGLVLIGPITPVQREGEPNEAPLAGAQVRVEEIPSPTAIINRPLFVWSGITNAEGRFQVRTPAGRFRVTARQALIVVDPPEGTIQQAANTGWPGSQATVEVTVVAGAFSAVTLHLDSGIR
jgi:hypothetical protein